MNLADKIDSKIFRTIGDVVDSEGIECYLIGGYVRDLLLSGKIA